MSRTQIGPPESTEYGAVYTGYISLVTETDIIAVLEAQRNSTAEFLAGIPADRGDYRYETGKWSVKEVIGHLVDTERIMTYRALRIARNDQTELPGFDQDTFVANANHGSLQLRELAQEYDAVRRATGFLFKHLEPGAWSRKGVANGNPVTVRALAYVVAGHERHHLKILKTRYV